MPVLVKDIMTKPVITINYNKNIKDAARLIRKRKKGALIVTKKRKPIGIITCDDIVYKVVAKDIKPSTVKVIDIMSEPLVSITPESSCVEAARKMRRNGIKRLPVVKSGKLIGIISLTDISTVIPEFTEYLEERLKMKEQPAQPKEGETTSGICDSCGEYSENLKYVNGQWLCETCRDELEE